MFKNDPLVIEEAERRARIFLEKMVADGARTEGFEHPAFVMYLAITQERARKNGISSPQEREAIVAEALARISGDCDGNK